MKKWIFVLLALLVLFAGYLAQSNSSDAGKLTLKGVTFRPAEPENIAGTRGRQHGLSIVTTPARNTRNIEGTDGSTIV